MHDKNNRDMILSASRRTDIPAFYSDWFYNRVKEGFVLVRNPMNFRQISRVKITPDVVDGIVFWTKNPAPMVERLCELSGYMYYFQFSVTPYGKDVELNLPQKNTEIISTFKKISQIVGADRVIWRYDPILLNEKCTTSYHLRAFEKIATELHKYTQRVTISFIDTKYKGLKGNMNKLNLSNFTTEMQKELAYSLAAIARKYGLAIDACAPNIDLQECGVMQACCIDGRLFSRLLSCDLDIEKDKNQRPGCGCAASIDIGMYNTCLNGCLYCYANYNKAAVAGNFSKHNPLSPLLYGEVCPEDKITDRDVKVYKQV